MTISDTDKMLNIKLFFCFLAVLSSVSGTPGNILEGNFVSFEELSNTEEIDFLTDIIPNLPLREEGPDLRGILKVK